jgi:hypothetical protein
MNVELPLSTAPQRNKKAATPDPGRTVTVVVSDPSLNDSCPDKLDRIAAYNYTDGLYFLTPNCQGYELRFLPL